MRFAHAITSIVLMLMITAGAARSGECIDDYSPAVVARMLASPDPDSTKGYFLGCVTQDLSEICGYWAERPSRRVWARAHAYFAAIRSDSESVAALHRLRHSQARWVPESARLILIAMGEIPASEVQLPSADWIAYGQVIAALAVAGDTTAASVLIDHCRATCKSSENAIHGSVAEIMTRQTLEALYHLGCSQGRRFMAEVIGAHPSPELRECATWMLEHPITSSGAH